MAAKRTRGRWKRCRAALSFLAVLLAILCLNDWMLRKATRANPSSRVNWVLRAPEQHFGIAILGSSLSKEGIDPKLLEERLDQDVVQLAWGGRGVSEQVLYWELFLQRHSCETLLLELNPRGLEEDVLKHPLDEFRYIAWLNEPVVWRHVSRHSGLTRAVIWRFVPMWAMAEFSTQIGWHDLLALRRGEQFDPNAPADNEHTGELQQMRKARFAEENLPGASAISRESIECFREIVSLCRKRGVRVIGVVPPAFGGRDTPQERQSLERYRQLLGDDVLILISSMREAWQDVSHFQDSFHLNRRGSWLYTAELAEQLRAELTELR